MLWQVARVHPLLGLCIDPVRAHTSVYLHVDGQLGFSRLFFPWTVLLGTSLHMSVGTRVRVSSEFIQKWYGNRVNIQIFKIIPDCFPKCVSAFE